MVFISDVSALSWDKEFVSLSVYSMRLLYIADGFRVLPSNKLKKQDKTQTSSDWFSDTYCLYAGWSFLSCR